MHIALTDLVTCPRCGPEHGLILRADRLEERRALEGALGCPNCHGQYPIRGGYVDMRLTPEPEGVGPAYPADPDAAVRLAALLGVTTGHGFVLVVGPGASVAPGLAALIEGLEVVAIDPSVAGWSEERGVDRVGTEAGRLPFRSRSMRGVALTGADGGVWLEEAARVVGARGRLVVDGAEGVDEARLAALGLEVLAKDGATLVAVPR